MFKGAKLRSYPNENSGKSEHGENFLPLRGHRAYLELASPSKSSSQRGKGGEEREQEPLIQRVSVSRSVFLGSHSASEHAFSGLHNGS